MTIVHTNAAALLIQAGSLIVESKKADSAHLADSVGRNAQRIETKSDDTRKVNDEVQDLQTKAQDTQEKADDTGFFGKLIGQKGRREREVQEISKDVQAKAGEAELMSVETDEIRDDNKEKLDSMKELSSDVSNTTAFLDRAIKRQVVMKP